MSCVPAILPASRGADLPVAQRKRLGIPLTRENYLNFAHPDGVPNPLSVELQTGVQGCEF